MEERSLSDQIPFETEIAQLLVTTLNLKVEPAEIPPLDPLFGEGLGLDSIDALEIALVIHQHYGYKLRSDDPDNATIFSSLRSLCEAIQKNRTVA
ncbi:MAG: acyl carrier protein [Nitrospirales bacterium]|nr:MAG: acyl carrier protein [Nitrospirales bacterium]